MSATTTTSSSPQRTAGLVEGHRSDGLHGHLLEATMARAAIAEGIGTFALVLTITSTVVAASLAKSVAGAPYGSVAVPVAGGFAVAMIVAGLGHISGAHLNPVVTLSLAVNRRFPWTYVAVYLSAQLTGAVSAALVTWALYGGEARDHVYLLSYELVGRLFIGVWGG